MTHQLLCKCNLFISSYSKSSHLSVSDPPPFLHLPGGRGAESLTTFSATLPSPTIPPLHLSDQDDPGSDTFHILFKSGSGCDRCRDCFLDACGGSKNLPAEDQRCLFLDIFLSKRRASRYSRASNASLIHVPRCELRFIRGSAPKSMKASTIWTQYCKRGLNSCSTYFLSYSYCLRDNSMQFCSAQPHIVWSDTSKLGSIPRRSSSWISFTSGTGSQSAEKYGSWNDGYF